MIRDEAEARVWIERLPQADRLALGRLDRLVAMLVEENRRQNLVSEASLAEVWRRHIADSAQLLRHAPNSPDGMWLDLGTGAGFPGLVVAILQLSAWRT
jgi:16S rRNA (guanine527-N7)-methyltransferase